MRIILLVIFSCVFFIQPCTARAADPYFKLLNSYHAIKLHLDKAPDKGQMKAASWLRFSNQTGRKTETIPLLLNPGLRISKIIQGDKTLLFEQKTAGLADWPELTLNVVSVSLPPPLKQRQILEITLYFEGNIQPLAASGMGYVKEYLSPDFTILRTENFSLPVVAEPNQSSLGSAARLQHYTSRMTLELPEGYIPAGNLEIEATKLLNGRIEYDLKSRGKVPFTIVPIARYEQLKSPSTILNYFEDQAPSAGAFNQQSEKTLALLENWFMPPHGGNKLVITAIPEGYGSQRMPGLIIQDSAAFSPKNYHELYHELTHIWHPRERVGTPSRWNEGLATFLEGVISKHFDTSYDLKAYKEQLYQSAKKHLQDMPEHKTTPLQEYGTAGITDTSYLTGAVYFALLHDSLGQDKFLTLIKKLQATYAATGIFNEDFADFMDAELKDRMLRKFAKNWFSAGTIGVDLEKTSSFQDLMSLYKQSSFRS